MSPALFQTALYASLVVCVAGLVWRISAWFRVRIGPDVRNVALSERLAAAFRGIASTLFGPGMIYVLRAFVIDVLLLRRLFSTEKPRWLGHQLVLIGFTLLILMHALAPLVSAKLFAGYQPTLAPYLFLRNLFGAMVSIGVFMLLSGRRRRRGRFARARSGFDAVFVGLLGIVLVTGFLLEADKIASPQAFYRMAGQFAGSTDPAELKPLRALWASEFGVAFDDLKQPIDVKLVEAGRKLHDAACAPCHAGPRSAFISYPLARALAPAARFLDDAAADVWLLYVHLFACFLGLASLPFTRFLHAVSSPLSLLVGGTASARELSPAARASQRALALDACVRCGICDLRCSVAPLARYLSNPQLLPSYKLIATGSLAGGRLLQPERAAEALRTAEGAFLCTDCGRCTSRCPVGLDLEDLWEAGRGDLTAAGLPAPAQWIQARPAIAWAEALESEYAQYPHFGADVSGAPLSAERQSFSRCVQCQTCTNVCPVVAYSVGSEHGIDLTPQKIMNLLRLGLGGLSLGSRMVWDCATCYQCQEHCPEGIRVTDIMYELRSVAVQRLGAVRSRKELS